MTILTEIGKGIQTENDIFLSEETPLSGEQILKQAYVNQKLGSLVCWNMPTFVDAEYANPNLDVDTFAPTGLDTDNWADTFVLAGMKYAILTVKHHDGFALWPTAYHITGYSPYSIAQTSWYSGNGSPDVVDLFVTSCRDKGITPGFYFSIWDQTYETRSGKTQSSDTAAYISMIETQLIELLTNYGDIEVIWFDGWGWELGYDYITYATIYNFVKSISPNTLVLENSQPHPTVTSEIEIYETAISDQIPEGNIRLSEAAESPRIDGKWFYCITADQSTFAYDLVATKSHIQFANDNNATFLLAATPNKAGVIPDAQILFYGRLA